MRYALYLFLIAIASSAGCYAANDAESLKARFKKRAKITVRPQVLQTYVGDYRLPSGALLPIRLKDGKLYAGRGEHLLLAQSTREFSSNQTAVQFIFEYSEELSAHRLNYRLGKRDLWIQPAVDAADPTQMISVGPQDLRVLVRGQGSPTVVIEDGFGSSIELRAELQAELAKMTRVVCYEHAGTGGSQPAAKDPRDARQIATELRTMLSNAQIEPPFIFVGGSIGGDYIRVFAHQNPDDMAGVVLCDPTPNWNELESWMGEHSSDQLPAFQDMIRVGHQLIEEMMSSQEPGRVAEWQVLEQSRRQAAEAFPLPSTPFTQITGSAGAATHRMAAAKVKFFEHWLNRNIPHAKHVLAGNSGHAVFAAQPKLVLREIRQMIEQHRGRSSKSKDQERTTGREVIRSPGSIRPE